MGICLYKNMKYSITISHVLHLLHIYIYIYRLFISHYYGVFHIYISLFFIIHPIYMVCVDEIRLKGRAVMSLVQEEEEEEEAVN